jgi:hypothetical protein
MDPATQSLKLLRRMFKTFSMSTKIENWTHSQLIETIGMDMVNNFMILPAIGSAGGFLLRCPIDISGYNHHQQHKTQ